MRDCRRIKKLIDEADPPESLSFDAARHIADCESCRAFTDERTTLRSLLGSVTRVAAPGDFDIVLQRRLGERTAAVSRGRWFELGWYLRLGAATACLVAAVLVVQNALFTTAQKESVAETESKESVASTGRTTIVGPEETPAPGSTVPAAVAGPTTRVPTGLRAADRLSRGARSLTSAVVFMRGDDGEMEVSLPRVTVGAQPLLYTSSGAVRSQPSAIKTSF
ncbi:MAG TPA: hypothetical protein VJH03_26895 [Blastocatellia bacterium]|nr:hypothetical protein [Blastocatellia bacterium]